jgi:hypothetical protein
MERIQGALFEWPEYSNQFILPNPSLEALINFQSVSAELLRMPSSDPLTRVDLHRYANAICNSNKKLFAILIFEYGDEAKWFKTMLGLIDEGITDSDLPFDRVYTIESESKKPDPRRPYKLSVRSHTLCTPNNHSCVIKTFKTWSRRELDTFSRDQWMVLSPVFRKAPGQIPHYKLGDRTLLPFIEDRERTQLLTGGYSDVWPVRICEGHQYLYQSPYVEVVAVNQSTTFTPC